MKQNWNLSSSSELSFFFYASLSPGLWCQQVPGHWTFFPPVRFSLRVKENPLIPESIDKNVSLRMQKPQVSLWLEKTAPVLLSLVLLFDRTREYSPSASPHPWHTHACAHFHLLSTPIFQSSTEAKKWDRHSYCVFQQHPEPCPVTTFVRTIYVYVILSVSSFRLKILKDQVLL